LRQFTILARLLPLNATLPFLESCPRKKTIKINYHPAFEPGLKNYFTMKHYAFLKSMAVAALVLVANPSFTQQKDTVSPNNKTEKPGPKPYRLLTAGKKITISSKVNVKKVMIWTATGNRVLEQDNINSTNYSHTISINEKIFFVMIETTDGKRFTEKIGLN
jgi:hypothetical protein